MCEPQTYCITLFQYIQTVHISFHLLASDCLQQLCNFLAIHFLQTQQPCHSWNIQTSLNTSQISKILFLLLVLGAVILLY